MNNVYVESLEKLLSRNLSIPEYQRAYTWGKHNIVNMIEDFEYFLKSDYKHLEYYLGTILLHEYEKNKFNIIDGQQRITTLLLFLKICNHHSFLDIEYDNPKSQYKIRENYELLLNHLLINKKELVMTIFPKIRFTVIITKNVDDAFTFFDTQNNRGVKPSVLVLLKSFNLRAISKNKFDIQKNCALKWEKHEKKGKDNNRYLSEEPEKLEWLIKIFLYRVRNWRSNIPADFGNYDSFRDQFTKNMRVSINGEYKKYPSYMNQINISNVVRIDSKYENDDCFAFAIRQPLYQGEGFFEFVDHYANLLDNLMNVELHNGKVFQDLVLVHRIGSKYIASFLSIITLAYYDRFGENQLLAFIKLMDVLLTNIRLKQGRILKQTMDKQFIRCEDNLVKQNILDFLCSAFDTDEVMDWLGIHYLVDYKDDDGVQGRFSKQHEGFWRINTND